MRDIKFRAWNTVNSKMYYNDSVTIGIGGHVYYLQTSGEWEQDDNKLTIMLSQFTGLKDKKGKCIYDGDILRDFNGDLFTIENWDGSVFRVVSNGITWEFLFQAHNNGNLTAEKGYEIVGNIYENPELLNS